VLGMVKRLFHEPVEWDRAAFFDFAANQTD
jgi:hypothetical protein